jgi:hypothetical protein
MIPDWFTLYFRLGFEHIVDVNGIDHLLFLLVITATYTFKDWKRVISIISLFTLGHTLSTGISLFIENKDFIGWIEWLIPLTIFFASLWNLRQNSLKNKGTLALKVSVLFGLIHGLGFGSFLTMLLSGEANQIELFLPFTLGIEVGQLLIVFVVLLITTLLLASNVLKQRDWVVLISGIGFGLSLQMLIERWPLLA